MFKRCTTCRHPWRSREGFLSDPAIVLIGYQVSFQELTAGLFLFVHNAPDCLTTIAMPTGIFTDLYVGEVFATRLTGTAQCPGRCLHKSDLEACGNKCECAYVREIIQIIRRWPKREAA